MGSDWFGQLRIRSGFVQDFLRIGSADRWGELGMVGDRFGIGSDQVRIGARQSTWKHNMETTKYPKHTKYETEADGERKKKNAERSGKAGKGAERSGGQ